jgi:hypothetical protein
MAEMHGWWGRPYIIATVYILRTALMNCVAPLSQSILMVSRRV